MKSVGTGKLRKDFRDQLAAAADTNPAIELMAEMFIPLHKTLCIARDALDDEKRFRKSIDVGAFLGLTPKCHQSGEVDWSGKISKCGDSDMRRILYSAASTLISCTRKPSRLKEWATKLAQRKGHKRAAVAASRKVAVIMHSVWRDGTVFEPGMEGAS